MAYDITRKRAAETAEIELVEGDGSPMLDDEGHQLTVTIHGPGSKLWQQADAERSRRRAQRFEKNRKASAAFEEAREDQLDFLSAITVSFNGWEYPHPEGKKWPTKRAEFLAAYSDDSIGYIRDHVNSEANNWSAFTKGSARS